MKKFYMAAGGEGKERPPAQPAPTKVPAKKK